MTYEQYEILVKAYFEKELQKTFNKEIEVKHQENLRTPTGREYNIDLNYKYRIAEAEYLTIIECKYWKSTITRDIILTLKEKAQDLGAHKPILVTTKGFQSGAIEYAREKGVALIKMTKHKNPVVYTNFIGVDFSNIISELKIETELLDEDGLNDSLGVAFPVNSIEYYLKNKFGEKIISILHEYANKLDDYNTSKLDEEEIALIQSISSNWYKEYHTIETCGISLNLSNARQLRIYNLVLFFLKSQIIENYKVK